MGKIDAVNKVIMFGFNYNHNFIEECWKDDNHMAKHLKGKFLDTYDRVGANAVFSVFYSNLDKGNREKLITYILNK